MGRPSFQRTDRLASSIREELAELFSFRKIKELKDTRFDGLISILDIQVKSGYQHIDVYISVLEEEKQKGVLEVLNDANSAIRGQICRNCKLRFAPTLAFHIDDSVKRGCEVWDLLDKIQANQSSQD
ncbi:MAG: 30S ribosome-binding factor RbfA [Candidatus Caenarcaniphilales bacterium]|nr:30S ribosome-binding factor RbfA [Candidatus Caenarcaniphilales bacterium]